MHILRHHPGPTKLETDEHLPLIYTQTGGKHKQKLHVD